MGLLPNLLTNQMQMMIWVVRLVEWVAEGVAGRLVERLGASELAVRAVGVLQLAWALHYLCSAEKLKTLVNLFIIYEEGTRCISASCTCKCLQIVDILFRRRDIAM